jgi:hypothetical protein
MSFDLFLSCFKSGKRATFPRSLVEEAFGKHIALRDQVCLTLKFGDKSESYLYCNDGELLDGFNINRPVDETDLYRAILSLLRAENLVLCIPGKCPPLIGRRTTASHLPIEMVASLGTPVLILAPAEIRNWIVEA